MARKWTWVGLDVGADEMTVCVTDDQGTVLIERLIPSKAAALHDVLKGEKRRIKLIGLESGSFGVVLSRKLRKLGYPVAIFDARQASKFLAIRRNKTDKNDARGIADIARLGRNSVSEVRVKTPECQRLRSTLVTRQKLVQLRIMLEAIMRSLFRLNGGRLKSCSSAESLKRNVSEELRRLRKSEKVDLSEDIQPLLALSAATRAYLEILDKRLGEMASNDPTCRRFLEIPGVGPITALCFYSAIQDPLRFRRNADVGAYLGLVPMVRQSGQTHSRLRISKMGDPMTRRYLTAAALHHLKHANSALSTWGGTLSERLRKGGVHVAVARKLAITMLAIWKSGQCYNPYHGLTPSRSGKLGNRNPLWGRYRSRRGLWPSLPINRPMSEYTIGHLLDRAGYHGHHVPHGFRSAFSTIMNERVERNGKPVRIGDEDSSRYVLIWICHVQEEMCQRGRQRSPMR